MPPPRCVRRQPLTGPGPRRYAPERSWSSPGADVEDDFEFGVDVPARRGEGRDRDAPHAGPSRPDRNVSWSRGLIHDAADHGCNAMTDKLVDLRKLIRGEGPKTAEQARKLARTALGAAAPEAMRLAEKLTDALEAIPIAEKLRGESEAARQSALDAVDDVAKLKRSKRNRKP
jgi:hypothetical protein